MERLPNLPIGQQYLKSIINGKSIYVDKTECIYELCEPLDRAYFLSRPRRFGKSLTVDTIHELFSGNKTLFKGLWIEDKWDWSQTYPVIRFSLDKIGYEDGLRDALIIAINKNARRLGVSIKSKNPGQAFEELIENVVEKTGKQVVILIDEYDRPIVDYIDPNDLSKANEQRNILKYFFGILKGASNHIRFLFITGVSKFAKVSIFSDLNHLYDLTLDARYAALCGYTQAELTHYFQPFFKQMPPDTLEKMKKWYNGYSWDAKTAVYNPFSVLCFFKNKSYHEFWFETGTPTFLVRILRARFDYKLEEVEVNNRILDSFTLENLHDLDITSLLLQTGYLTIKEITPYNNFILNYPNEEVKNAFAQLLLGSYVQKPPSMPHIGHIAEAFDKNHVARVIHVINDLVQSIPDQNYVKDEEKFFHAIIHLIFTIVGTDVRSEVHTPIGRMDTIVVTKNRIFLFEFKLNEPADAAIQCVKDRHYAEHLRHRNIPITAIGVSFSTKTKGVAEWKTEEV